MHLFFRKKKIILFVIIILSLVFTGCFSNKSVKTHKKESGKTSQKKDSTVQQPYKVYGKYYHPVSSSDGFTQKGIASWYGKKFHGRKTSNGETYNMYGLSAAHKTLPFGTYVLVHNLDNGKKLTIRVNDRGPFAKNRIIDLSYGAAKKLGVVGPGTAKVKIKALGKKKVSKSADKKEKYVPVDYTKGNFTIQVAAFKEKKNAENFKKKYSKKYKHVHIVKLHDGNDVIYKIRIGKASSFEKAVEYENTLMDHGFASVFIVAE